MVITENFGRMLASHFVAQGGGSGFSWIDIGGVANSSTCYGSHLANKYNRIGTLTAVQVGKGSTPATNLDINVENPFVGGVESTRRSSNNSGYISGLGKIQTPTQLSNTLGSGSITEVCLYARWHDAPLDPIVLLFRDIVSVETFIAGETINVEHEVLI